MKGFAALILTFLLLLLVVALPRSQQVTHASPTADIYEPDDSQQDAGIIYERDLQQRTISPAGDVDWVELAVEPGEWWVDFRASTSTDLGAITISLYDSDLNRMDFSSGDGDALIGYNCDYPLSAGTYYLKVESQDGIELGDYTLIWQTYENCSQQPDVQPYTPAGYSYPVTPNSVKGTTQANSTLYAGKPTYFDWFFINAGNSRLPDNYYSRVSIDGVLAFQQKEQGINPGSVGGANDWAYTVPTPGWHTVRFETDATNVAIESDESNNVWERDFYWEPVEFWWGEYFNNINLAGDPVFVSTAREVDFDWGTDAPGLGVNADGFSARWTRDIYLGAGSYLFTLTYDDAMSLFIDEQLRAQGLPGGTGQSSLPLNVSVGWHGLRVEMYDSAGPAVARMSRFVCQSLTRTVSPATGGTIVVQPTPNCGSKYVKNTLVTLTASPATGYKFTNWSGALSGEQTEKSLIIDDDTSVTANFASQYTLKLSVNGAGSIVADPDKPFYSANENVSLTATAEAGNRFIGWSGGLSGSQNPAILKMSSNRNVTAHFGPIPCYTLTVNGEPPGTLATYETSPLPNCAGEKFLEGTSVTLRVQANGPYSFSHWAGDLSGSQNPATLTMGSNKNVTAYFTQDCFSLAATAEPVGGGAVDVLTPANCSGGKYTAGMRVNLSARKNGGYFFTNWSGDAQGSNPSIWLTMDGNKQVVAHFSQPACYSVTTAVTPALAGQVDVSPNADCSGGRYLVGTQITLLATPGAAYVFDHWSGAIDGSANPRTLAINGDKTLTAHFRAKSPACYPLTLDHSGDGRNPSAVPDRSPGCVAGNYVAGEAIALTAYPTPGQRVARWEGTADNASHSLTNTTTMPVGNHAVVAHYELSPVVGRLFIPLANHEPCFTGQEVEPNDKRDQANGPVCLGQPLFGRPDGGSDYFRLEVDGPWLLDVEMVNNIAQSPQLLLYDAHEPILNKTLDQATRPPFRITYLLPPGVYYLRVAITGGETNTIYTLLFH